MTDRRYKVSKWAVFMSSNDTKSIQNIERLSKRNEKVLGNAELKTGSIFDIARGLCLVVIET